MIYQPEGRSRHHTAAFDFPDLHRPARLNGRWPATSSGNNDMPHLAREKIQLRAWPAGYQHDPVIRATSKTADQKYSHASDLAGGVGGVNDERVHAMQQAAPSVLSDTLLSDTCTDGSRTLNRFLPGEKRSFKRWRFLDLANPPPSRLSEPIVRREIREQGGERAICNRPIARDFGLAGDRLGGPGFRFARAIKSATSPLLRL